MFEFISNLSDDDKVMIFGILFGSTRPWQTGLMILCPALIMLFLPKAILRAFRGYNQAVKWVDEI